jgi:predicted ATPase
MAREMAEQGLRLAQNFHNLNCLKWAHFELGEILCWLGEFTLAREHVEAGIASYDFQQYRSYSAPEDPKVSCLSSAAPVLWCLGFPNQALQRCHETLTLAQELSHPYSLVVALDLAVRLHQLRREVQLARESAEAVIALSTEQGFPHWLVLGTIWRGWALAEQGQVEEGIIQIRQGLAARRAKGAEGRRPYFLAQLAAAYGKGGQVEEGLTVLAEALAIMNKTGERFYEAELYRLKGQLTLQKESQTAKGKRQKSKIETDPRSLMPDTQGEAEACFLKAIDIARKQQAKMWELRATVSLARLWQCQGKKEQARQMLGEIYGWFTEGFDTKDLQEAEALLAELSH